jgi:hypothetical protein
MPRSGAAFELHTSAEKRLGAKLLATERHRGESI